MKIFSIKNNNIYYYNFQVFNGELSLLLVPLVILLVIINNNFLKYFSNICIIIFICGIIDSYKKSLIYKLPSILYINFIFHTFTLYPLINFKKYFKPNIINYILGIIGIIIINILPYWPYSTERSIFSYIIIIVYLITSFIYYFTYNNIINK